MSWLENAANLARRIDDALLSIHPRIRLSPRLTELLTQHPVVIADVGAAGGPDPRWSRLSGHVRFLSFEPRTGENAEAPGAELFPLCLGAEPGQRTLFLTRFGQSSSLYSLNLAKLGDYATAHCYETIGTTTVRVDTLDHCLQRNDQSAPDFLKIDVEGAELDVLQGAQETLAKSILGLQIEVSFLERHCGAPLFGEIDAFLRKQGFEIFTMSRESLIRKNKLHTASTQPQIVWGDCLYLRTRQSLLDRLQSEPAEARPARLAKAVCLLLSYRACDFAMEIVDACRSAGLVSSPEFMTELEEVVRASTKHEIAHIVKATGGALVACCVYLACWPAQSTRSLGTAYLKRRAGYVFHYFWRMCARRGEENACVGDLFL
jgi:FkbM family methyltransferase